MRNACPTFLIHALSLALACGLVLPAFAETTTARLCGSSKEEDRKTALAWQNNLTQISLTHVALRLQAPRADALKKAADGLIPLCEEARAFEKEYDAFAQASLKAPSSGEVCDAYSRIEENYSFLQNKLGELEKRFEKYEKELTADFTKNKARNYSDINQRRARLGSGDQVNAKKLEQELAEAWGRARPPLPGIFPGILKRSSGERQRADTQRKNVRESLGKIRTRFPDCPTKLKPSDFSAGGSDNPDAAGGGKKSGVDSGIDGRPGEGQGSGDGAGNSDGSSGNSNGSASGSPEGKSEEAGLSDGAKAALIGGGVLAAAGLGGAYYLKQKYGLSYGQMWDAITNAGGGGGGPPVAPAFPPENTDLGKDEPDSKPGTAYSLEGKHKDYGAYKGQVEWRTKADGTLEALRVITYDAFQFEGFRVQEVWAGTGKEEGGMLTASFRLKQADLYSKAGDHQHSPDQFRNPLLIEYSAPLKGGPATVKGAAWVENETLTGTSTPGSEKPAWKNLRRAFGSKGESSQYLGRIAAATFFKPIIDKYRADPFVAGYKDRSEYKSEMQYYILDATDFDFLRTNPNTIRVNNKVTDPVSLVEAAIRRDAYAPTLTEKATLFEKDAGENNLNELGLINLVVYDGAGKKVRVVPEGDSALWTGMYAGSQAMRWLATHDSAALENFKKAVSGLMLLMDITGDNKEFARNAIPINGESIIPEKWLRGVGPYANMAYLPGGNNDMLKGIFHGFAWAFQILPKDDPFRAQVALHAIRLPDLKVSAELSHIRNGFLASGLASVANHDQGQHAKYLAKYLGVIVPADGLGVSKGFYFGGMADWSGTNLGMVTEITEILVSSQVQQEFGGSLTESTEKSALKNARQNLVEYWATYAGAHKEFLAVAAHTFGLRGDLFGLDSGTIPTSWPHQDRWAVELGDSAWLLREFPIRRNAQMVQFDHSLRPDWCVSAWPNLPWKSFTEDPPMTFYYQGAYQYPFFEGGFAMDGIRWISGFDYKGQGGQPNPYSHVDYLYLYWMGRLSGVTKPSD